MDENPHTPADDPLPADSGPIGGLFKSLSNLVATVIAIAQTRLELLTTELQEEMHRVAEILLWTLIALLSAGVGLILAAIVVVLVFWDTHRVAAGIAVTGAFFVLALAAALVMRAKVRSMPRMLDATLAELAKDREKLGRRQ